MTYFPSPTGDLFGRQFHYHPRPQSTDEQHSSLFHALISGVDFRSVGHGSQLNLARDILQRQVEQSQAAPGSRSIDQDAGLAIELDSELERLIALVEYERPTSSPPSTIHDADSNILEERIVFNEQWSFTIRTAASRTVIESLPSVVLREEDVVCSICIEGMRIGEEAKQLPCIHRYHGVCIRAWLQIQNTCPICRYELPKD